MKKKKKKKNEKSIFVCVNVLDCRHIYITVELCKAEKQAYWDSVLISLHICSLIRICRQTVNALIYMHIPCLHISICI